MSRQQRKRLHKKRWNELRRHRRFLAKLPGLDAVFDGMLARTLLAYHMVKPPIGYPFCLPIQGY